MADWKLLLMVIVALLWSSTEGVQVQHIVGDSMWTIPPTNDFYTNWSSSYSFHIGDTLYFEFDSGLYNVIQVSRGAFDDCSGDQPYEAIMDGPAILSLSLKGVFYYICNVSNYCALGLKVSVIVDQLCKKSLAKAKRDRVRTEKHKQEKRYIYFTILNLTDSPIYCPN